MNALKVLLLEEFIRKENYLICLVKENYPLSLHKNLNNQFQYYSFHNMGYSYIEFLI